MVTTPSAKCSPVVLAGTFNFQEADLFEIEKPAEREAVRVVLRRALWTSSSTRTVPAARRAWLVLFAAAVAAIIAAIYRRLGFLLLFRGRPTGFDPRSWESWPPRP